MRVFRCSKFGKDCIIFFFPERRVEVYSFNRDSLWGPNNEIAPFSFCYTKDALNLIIIVVI